MKKFIFTITVLSFVLLVTSCKSTEVNEKETATEKVADVKKETTSIVESEYERATKDLVDEKVSRETFEEDKKTILQKISELNSIMKNFDYNSWINYIDQSSINYWSLKSNLSSASKKLPVKGIQLKSLQDYFRYVFVPSRMGRKIDEIRYISSKSIKAVQVRDEDIIIFYNFKKINGEWFVELPAL